MSQRFFRACALVFAGIIALTLAVSLLEKIWPWLLAAALIAIGIWVCWRLVKARRRDRDDDDQGW